MNSIPENIVQALQVPVSSEQLEALLYLQQSIMEKVALGYDHQLVLDELCRAAEAMLPNAVASIMLFDKTGDALQVRSAPNIPEAGVDALNGLVPGEHAGSCGTAVYTNVPQFVCDTSADDRWSAEAFQAFARDFGVDACWSMPIKFSDNQAIGSFALSSMEKRQPHAFHRKLLETCAHIAGIVLRKEQQEEQLWRLAHHDNLTNLPNRLLFTLRLEHAIEQAKRSDTHIAILFIDLDHFKRINDTLGHDAGDEALREAARRMQGCIRQEDTLARMGGDEFILMLENLANPLDAQQIAASLIEQFESPVVLNQHNYLLTASVGISLFPDDGGDVNTLLQHADIAMYEAKKQGRNQFIYYEPWLADYVANRLQLETELREAIDAGQIVLHYQPQYDCDGSQLLGAEVLVRWQHPSRGLLPPAEFIPLAEDTGLIDQLGCYITREACRQCLQWWAQGLPRFLLSINLSVRQLQPGCAGRLEELLAELSFPAEQLEMEVTETLIMARGSDAVTELNGMREQGVSIAMDDFGTGHSSLAQIKNLPITKLKIDRSFVQDIPADDSDVVIVRTILAMARTLGLRVVAEGVETQAQRQFLRDEGCDIVQGYLLGKPVDAEAFRQQYLAGKAD